MSDASGVYVLSPVYVQTSTHGANGGKALWLRRKSKSLNVEWVLADATPRGVGKAASRGADGVGNVASLAMWRESRGGLVLDYDGLPWSKAAYGRWRVDLGNGKDSTHRIDRVDVDYETNG